ncbi:MAG TPA: LysM peptidoglycan-binding domain-containing protein [Candidatus Acidoferrales bacterium]|nr:LysM peptidoglycan-binding domain-containing protein [Candidatus Acidoferrales bacterium]
MSIQNPPRPIPRLFAAALATVIVACTHSTPPLDAPRAPLAPPELRSADTASAEAIPYGAETATVPAASTPVVWREDHPARYVVRRGDTLWDIAARFLRDPWRWPEVWRANPQVRNPHRIYPGDELEVAMIDGQRRLQPVEPPLPVERLTPTVRREPIETAIPALPYERIAPFLNETASVDPKALSKSPYVLRAFNAEQLVMGSGDRIYVRGTDAPAGTVFQIVTETGSALRDPDTRKLLGHQVDVLGSVRITQAGDPAEALIIQSRREIHAKQRLLPIPESVTLPDLLPSVPRQTVSGRVLLLTDAISQAGQHQSVTLSVGRGAGVEVGHVLTVYGAEDRMQDPVRGGTVVLPERAIGNVLIFRVSESVSQGLIVRSTRSIKIGDRVATSS